MQLIETEDVAIPHDVVEMVIKKDINLLKAWRLYLKLNQGQLANKAGISQSALSQMENSSNEKRTSTLKKLAAAMGVKPEQLRD